MVQRLPLNTQTASYWANPVFVAHREPEPLTGLYRFSNDIPVHSLSTGCPTLTQSRWAPSCHTWRGTNLTWQKWVGISILLIKMGRVGKTFLRGHSIKEKAWGLFHSCFAHWPESSGAAGNGVIGSVEARSTEGRFTLFGVLKKYTRRTAHTRSPALFVSHTYADAVQGRKQSKADKNSYINICETFILKSVYKEQFNTHRKSADLLWSNFWLWL